MAICLFPGSIRKIFKTEQQHKLHWKLGKKTHKNLWISVLSFKSNHLNKHGGSFHVCVRVCAFVHLCTFQCEETHYRTGCGLLPQHAGDTWLTQPDTVVGTLKVWRGRWLVLNTPKVSEALLFISCVEIKGTIFTIKLWVSFLSPNLQPLNVTGTLR